MTLSVPLIQTPEGLDPNNVYDWDFIFVFNPSAANEHRISPNQHNDFKGTVAQAQNRARQLAHIVGSGLDQRVDLVELYYCKFYKLI